MTIARLAHLVLALSLAACASSTVPAESPETEVDPAAAQASKSGDPCASLPLCPVACPVPVESLAGLSCGSEGLSCGSDASVCSCEGASWKCDRPEKRRGASMCEKSCREET